MAIIRYYVKDKRGNRVGGEVSSKLYAFDHAFRSASDTGEPMTVFEHFALTPEMETDRPLGTVIPPGVHGSVPLC